MAKKKEETNEEAATADAPDMPAEEAAEMPEAVNLVRMVREESPFTADVHPNEVGNYSQGGWVKEEK